jgi:N-acetylneuraminic acid mutarotase
VPDHGRGYNRYQQAVWTGAEMFLLGGAQPIAAYSKFVAAYSPSTTTWRIPAQLPEGKGLSFAAWTGSQVLVWGGTDGLGAASATGYVYDVASDSWTKMAASPLSARNDPVGVWVPATNELVVWGGDGNADGAAYNPSTDKWRTLAAATIGGRSAATAVLAGGKVVVFGGNSGGAQCADAGVYDPVADSWAAYGVQMSWQREYGQSAAASTDTAYFWGGSPPVTSARGVSWSGGNWSLFATPSSATLPDASLRLWPGVWFGAGKLWVWGGMNSPAFVEPTETASGAAFDPASSSWSAMPTAPWAIVSPISVVWTGREAIFWGERPADPSWVMGVGGLLYRP